MSILILGIAVFLGMHSISIVTPGLRARIVASMGPNRWRGVYSLVSAAGFVLILYGFHLARQAPVVLYVPPAWMRHVTFLLMLPVFPLILAAYLPGRIKTAMKHPMLAAVKFWAFAHLLSNGLLADVLLFGAFLVWAICDRISLKRRPQQTIGTAPQARFNDLIAVIAGLALYVFFILWAHVRLFGDSPLG
ncbi:MAG: NnrU family protein [Steroidobacteraceae bacterium]